MYVCVCNGVTDRQIREAVAQGAASLDDLARELQVGTCCGKCRPCAGEVLQKAMGEGSFAPGLQPVGA